MKQEAIGENTRPCDGLQNILLQGPSNNLKAIPEGCYKVQDTCYN